MQCVLPELSDIRGNKKIRIYSITNMSWSRSPPSYPSPPTPESRPSEYDDSPPIETQEEYYYRMNPHLDPNDAPFEHLVLPHHDQQYHNQPLPDGIAYHVHNAFDNIEDNLNQINDTLGGPHFNLTSFNIGNSGDDFMNGFYECCVQILERHYTGDAFHTRTDKLSQILDKLAFARREYLTVNNIQAMFTWIQFVLRQPDAFQKYYVDLYIEDTFHAYEGQNDTISCPKGIVHRVLLAIADACLLYCVNFKKPRKKTKKKKNGTGKSKKNRTFTQQQPQITGGKFKSMYSKCDNPIYKKLIRLFKKEVPDLNSLSQEWAVILDDSAEIATMSAEDLKLNFIKFMKRKYKLYGLIQTDQIMKRATEYEEAEIFKRKEFG